MLRTASTPALLCLALTATALVSPTAAEAQTGDRIARVRTERAFELRPSSACLRLSTMQIGSNAQKAMRSGAQNHNSSRSNRTQPMARPDLITDDDDGDGFPDVFRQARIRMVAPGDAGRRGAARAGPEVWLEIGASDDEAISGLADATTFRVTRASRGNPLHTEAARETSSPLFERSAAGSDDGGGAGPTRVWSWALVAVGGGADADDDGYGDALEGATLHVTEAGGRFHVDLELAAGDPRGRAERLGSPSFRIGGRSVGGGR